MSTMDGIKGLGPNGQRVTELGLDDAGFGQVLLDAVQSVSDSQRSAERTATNFVNDPGAKIHETMLQMQKADISLRTFVTVRNKMLDAYREIMQMGM